MNSTPPHNRPSLSLEEAKDFTQRFCRPQDDKIVSKIVMNFIMVILGVMV